MRAFLSDLAGNTSVLVAALVLMMSAAAWAGHRGQPAAVLADVLAWSPAAVPADGEGGGTELTIGGGRYVLTIRPEPKR